MYRVNHIFKHLKRSWTFFFIRAWAVFACLAILPSPTLAQPMEYLLKAGFLEKFARFTDWPEQAGMSNTGAPFVISVLGESPFEGSLEKIYKQAKIKDKPVQIRYIKRIDEIPGSHMLFICASEAGNLAQIINAAIRHSVLLVSDTEGLAEKGAHINLYVTKKGTLHFEVNVRSVKQSGLSVQLVLLEIARVVGG